MLRSVSHDLRSPLTAIGASAEMLAEPDGLAESDRAELLASIRDQARRLDRLVGNLLDLSRLEAGAARPVRELWPVDELVGRALEALGPDGDRVARDAAGGEPRGARGRGSARARPRQPGRECAAPLVARRSGRGGRACGGGEVVIAVTDRGPGVPADDHESIFEPFWTGGGGSGLGLAIARGFATLNGGRLWVESELGRGATFSLALPGGRDRLEVTA